MNTEKILEKYALGPLITEHEKKNSPLNWTTILSGNANFFSLINFNILYFCSSLSVPLSQLKLSNHLQQTNVSFSNNTFFFSVNCFCLHKTNVVYPKYVCRHVQMYSMHMYINHCPQVSTIKLFINFIVRTNSNGS